MIQSVDRHIEVHANSAGCGIGTAFTDDDSVERAVTVQLSQRRRPVAQIADAGRGAFHEADGEDGIRSLIADLRTISGRTDAVPQAKEDPTNWLVLLGLVLLLLDAVFDTGIALRRRS